MVSAAGIWIPSFARVREGSCAVRIWLLLNSRKSVGWRKRGGGNLWSSSVTQTYACPTIRLSVMLSWGSANKLPGLRLINIIVTCLADTTTGDWNQNLLSSSRPNRSLAQLRNQTEARSQILKGGDLWGTKKRTTFCFFLILHFHLRTSLQVWDPGIITNNRYYEWQVHNNIRSSSCARSFIMIPWSTKSLLYTVGQFREG